MQNSEKLLGIKIDSKLSFKDHIRRTNKSCKKRLIMNTFSSSQFVFCPTIRMFYSRECKHYTNR